MNLIKYQLTIQLMDEQYSALKVCFHLKLQNRFSRIDLFEGVDYHTFYIDNIKTARHKSLLVGIRELYDKKVCTMQSLPKITGAFLSNYFIRIYSSGCWKSNRKEVRKYFVLFRWAQKQILNVHIVILIVLRSIQIIKFFFLLIK